MTQVNEECCTGPGCVIPKRAVCHGIVEGRDGNDAWGFRGPPPGQRGAAFLRGMVSHQTVCMRRLGGDRHREVQFGRFLANERVTKGALIDGWSLRTRDAVAGRHVLAIQDTTEAKFATAPGRRRGLGKVKKGTTRGLLAHTMIAVDAASGACLGGVGGDIWTRGGNRRKPHS